MLINSHKQLPKLIMKQFCHQNPTIRDGAIWVLPFSDMILPSPNNQQLTRNVVAEVSISDLGTEFGYYDDEVENAILSKSVETPFAQFINGLCKILDSDYEKIDSNRLTQYFTQHYQIIYRFLDYNLFRDNKVSKRLSNAKLKIPQDVIDIWQKNKEIDISYINSLSRDEQLLEIKTLTGIDYSNEYTQNSAIKRIGHMDRHWHEQFFVGIIINTTELDFIVGKSCNYSCRTKSGEQHLVFPFNPKFAFYLYEKNGSASDTLMLQVIRDKRIIDACNKNCIQTEIRKDKEFIIARNKSDLLNLLDFVKLELDSK